MHTLQLSLIAALVVATSACKPQAEKPSRDADLSAQADAQSDEESSRRDAPNAAPAAPERGGAFAREPGFQLPVPVSSTPVGPDAMAQGRPADPVEVRAAVMESLKGSNANVQVQVSPRGIVSLSGEVGSIADLQSAHYIARAQPGVVEVDYRSLVVRRP